MNYLMFLFLLFSAPVFSATRVAGGGHIVICKKTTLEPASYSLLDFYEVKYTHFLNLKLPPDGQFTDPNLRVQQKAILMLERLRPYSPLRYKWYKWQVENFFGQLARFISQDLRFKDDSFYDVLNENCEIKQLALQKEKLWLNDYIYLVDLRLWSLLDLSNRAGLLLHEIVYNEFISYGHKDSLAARRFVGAIVTDEMSRWTMGTPSQRAFLLNLFGSEVEETDLGGIWVKLWDFRSDNEPEFFKNIEFHENSHMLKNITAEAIPNTTSIDGLTHTSPEVFTHIPRDNRTYIVNGFEIKIETDEYHRVRLPIHMEFDLRGTLLSLESLDRTVGKVLFKQGEQWVEVSHLKWNSNGELISVE